MRNNTSPAPAAAAARARPLAGYIGGKWFLRSTICPLIDADHHRCYVEPFLGMGNVFLGRERRAAIEVINDKSDQVVTLFRVVQRHPDELVRALRLELTSRAGHDRLIKVDPGTLTDVERAARFLVLRRLTFACLDPHPGGFGTSKISPKLFDAGETTRRIEALHRRLDRVTIECLDFDRCLATYDGPQTFFYLDPPYWGATRYYKEAGFTQADFPRLAHALERLKGRWLMSLNDKPEVRKLFARFRIRPVEGRYSAHHAKGRIKSAELLISKR
jgi:DNA adenine methylase